MDIAANAAAIASNDLDIASNTSLIEEEVARATTAEQANATAISAETARATAAEVANRGLIDSNTSAIRQNELGIQRNQMDIMQMREDIRELNAGVAMSMALAGMPTVGGLGTSMAVGMGNFNSESAVAIGISHAREASVFKLGVTYTDIAGAGVSAGAAFKLK